jgi:hypothetical protein
MLLGHPYYHMLKELAPTIVSFLGVGISAFVSWLVSRRQVTTEIRKLRLEMQRAYAERLHEARLSCYPKLYAAIQGYAKLLQRRSINFDYVSELYKVIDSWHTENGLLLSADTNGRLYIFLRKIRGIIERSEQAFAQRVRDSEKRRQMIRDAWSILLGLKNDLGVFEVEFFDPDKRFRTYKEIEAVLDQNDV